MRLGKEARQEGGLSEMNHLLPLVDVFLKCSNCKARGWYSGTKSGIWLDLCILRNSETTHKIYETFALHQ